MLRIKQRRQRERIDVSLWLQASQANQGPDHHTQTRRCLRGSCTRGKVKTVLRHSDPLPGGLVRYKLKVLSHTGDSF